MRPHVRAPAAIVTDRRPWFWIGATWLVILTLGIGIANVASLELEKAQQAHEQVQRTRDALSMLQNILSALQDAETGERGYVITGHEVFLAPYHSARAALPESLRTLSSLLTLAQSRANLAQLSDRAEQQLAFLSRVIDAKQAGRHDQAVQWIAEETGKRQMDEIRALIAAMQMQQHDLLNSKMQEFTTGSARSRRVVNLSLLSAAAISLFAAALLLRYTQRGQEAESAAEHAALLLASTMNNVSEGIAVFDRNRHLLNWNTRYLELRRLDASRVHRGMEAEELFELSARHDETPVDDSRGRVTSQLKRLDFSKPFNGETRDSSGMVLQLWGRPIDDGSYILAITDITALRSSEAAYRDRATRLTSTLDNVVDAIITINESGSIESWSKGAERLFGYAPQEVLLRNVKMLMPEPHASAHDGYLRNYLTTGERKIIGIRRQVEALHKEGRRIPVDLGISEMQIGERRLFVGIVRDISERLAVERMKANFISTVSHELRTPLTSIGGSLGLLAAGVAGSLPERSARLVEIARQNCSRLIALINDILDLEKAESGKLDLKLEQQRLMPIVAHSLELNQGYAESYAVRLQLMTTSTDASVFVDRDRLIQVLTNLISNAIKHSPKDGTVTLTLQVSGDRAVVSVTDQGAGVPPAFESRIFQKFSQADASDSRAKGGTGLGLSIVKTLMERFGGAVDFERNRTHGARFFITLPAMPVNDPPAETPALTGRQHILVCEDDPDVAKILTLTLENDGMLVEHANTAARARTALARESFDLAIIDVHLPDGNGVEFIREFRRMPALQDLPVIVVSAGRNDRMEGSVASLRVTDWLQKPLDAVQLVMAVRRSIAQRHANQPM